MAYCRTACTCTLTKPSPPSTVALPPLPHTIALWGAYRMQCGAHCAGGGACVRACANPGTADRDRPRANTLWDTKPAPYCARLRQQNAAADVTGILRRGIGCQQGPPGGSSLLECAICWAAITSRVPTKCSLQPTLL